MKGALGNFCLLWFLLFVLLCSQRVASHSCATLQELLHRPEVSNSNLVVSRCELYLSHSCARRWTVH